MLSPEADALLHPHLDRPALLRRATFGELPAAPAARATPAGAALADRWIQAAEDFLRHDDAAVLASVTHDLDDRCRRRATELHRSLVEVLTSLTVLRGVDPTVLQRRQAVLSSSIDRLTALGWRPDPVPAGSDGGLAGGIGGATSSAVRPSRSIDLRPPTG